MATGVAATDFPWFPTREEDRRFRWILAQSLALSLLLGVIMPQIRVPVAELAVESESPPRLVRLLPQPAAPSPQSRGAPAETVKAVPAPPVQQVRPPRGSAVGETRESTQPQRAAARIQDLDAALSGLKMWDPATAAEGVGEVAPAGESVAVRDPSILTREVTRGSGGGVSDLSPLAILGRGVSPALEGDGEGGGEGAGEGAGERGGGNAGAPGRGAGRSGLSGPVRARWEIQEVLDRNKGGIYTLYNRELRVNPELNGTMLLTITIDASGRVTRCRVIDSELDSPSLERDLLALIRQIDFGNRPGVPVVTTRIPIEFFPR